MTWELIPFLAMYAALAVFAVMVMRKNHDINQQCWRPRPLSRRHITDLQKRNSGLSKSDRRLENKRSEFEKLKKDLENTRMEVIVTRRIAAIEVELEKVKRELEQLDILRKKPLHIRSRNISFFKNRTG